MTARPDRVTAPPYHTNHRSPLRSGSRKCRARRMVSWHWIISALRHSPAGLP
jgi:hypothetical protein